MHWWNMRHRDESWQEQSTSKALPIETPESESDRVKWQIFWPVLLTAELAPPPIWSSYE
jgi:hypothetical protein